MQTINPPQKCKWWSELRTNKWRGMQRMALTVHAAPRLTAVWNDGYYKRSSAQTTASRAKCFAWEYLRSLENAKPHVLCVSAKTHLHALVYTDSVWWETRLAQISTMYHRLQLIRLRMCAKVTSELWVQAVLTRRVHMKPETWEMEAAAAFCQKIQPPKEAAVYSVKSTVVN